jgi:hypothetical protein
MKEDFNKIAKTKHPAGIFLKDHALTSIDFFKNNVPELYDKIYKGTNKIAYCYDPLCMLAVTHPELFTWEKFGHHRIAVDIEAEKAKDILVTTIVEGLGK